MNLVDFSRKGGLAKSAAKTKANRAKMKFFWKQVRAGRLAPPRRRRRFPDAITALARTYIWWMTPEEALMLPRRVAAQVMDIGTMEDCATVQTFFGRREMGAVLRNAAPGWFRDRSWTYWHYRLGLTPWGDEPPPVPVRTCHE